MRAVGASIRASRSATYGQPSHPNSGFFENDHRPCLQIGLDGSEVCDQKLDLPPRTTLGTAAKQDHGWVRSCREQGPKVGVGRHDNALFRGGPAQDLLIGGLLHAQIMNVNCVVAGGAKIGGDDWRQRVVNEEFQTTDRSGSSRSRTASAA